MTLQNNNNVAKHIQKGEEVCQGIVLTSNGIEWISTANIYEKLYTVPGAYIVFYTLVYGSTLALS